MFTNKDYKKINQMRNNLLKQNDSIFSSVDFSIAIFKSSLGNEYILLYKNFENRKIAEEYCNKYGFFLDNCLIVNVQNLD